MAIKIQNLRITPYNQKNELKAVWGDTLTLTFTIPHVAGESYIAGLDNDRVVYPPSRPVCAYTNVFTRDGDDITFNLNLNTSKFRSYVSSIRKPMPVWLQVCRVGLDGKCETLVLDDILALPSVLDATNTVCEGDPLAQLLDGKMDKPAASGTEGQVLTMDADGHYAWEDLPKQEQSDFDESDSSLPSFIRNRPVISTVGHTGEYNDLLNKPDLNIYVEKVEGKGLSTNDFTDADKEKLTGIEAGAEVNVQANFDESDSSLDSYIRNRPVISQVGHTGEYNDILNRPDLKTVATTGSYNDLIDKPTIPAAQVQADYGQSDSQSVDYVRNKPDLNIYVEKVEGKGLSTNDFTDADKSKLDNIEAGAEVNVQADFDESDSSLDSYIRNRPVISTVGHTGEYDDLLNKPTIPAAQVQADYGQSDSQAVDYVRNKPVLATVATTGNYWSLSNRPAVPYNTGDYFTIQNNTSNSAGSTVVLEKVGSPRDNTFQYCTNGSTDAWSDYTLGSTITIPQYGYVKFRNKEYGKLLGNGSASNYYHFVITGNVWLSGNLVSMKDRTMSAHAYAGGADMYAMFKDNAAITDASGLIIPINDVNVNTYASMFENCTGMVYGPAELPAMKFSGVNCYMAMFKGCTSLKVAPRLPAVTLTNNCYMAMFEGCTSLIEPPPELPAPVLLQQSYRQMFKGCTALTKSPDIKATTLANSSMYEMFSGCSALNEVKIAFSDFAPSGVTTPVYNWMDSTGTGVFRCPAALSISTRDASTVPSGWMLDRIDDPRSNWEESDSTESSYVMNRPEISGGGSDNTDYLCFTAGQDGSTVRLDKSNASLADVDLEYSLDKQSWTTYTWSDTTGETITLANAGDKVWFRGDNQRFSTSSSLYYSFVVTALDTNKPGLRVDGNIMSLLDKSCKSVTIPCDYCFYYLFKNQWRIMSAPYLPAVDFGSHKYCYAYMFYACSGLNEVHDFPVFNSFYDCNYLFSSMFSGCKSLTKVPKFDLGEASIPNGLCQSMFYDCWNLVDASGFTGGKGGNGSSASSMGESAFYSMFRNCTSLTVPPSIWYTISSTSSFELMFSGCTSLVNAPELFVQSKRQYCFKSMFSGCTSLVNAPKLVGGTNNFCYESMFSGCTSLVNAPELNASTAYQGCYRSMFSGCTSLVNAPKLPATTLTPYCYQSMFSGCTSLVNAPELNASTLADQCYKLMFNGCTSLRYLRISATTSASSATDGILSGVTTSGVLVAPDSLDVSGFMPATWTKVDAANEPDDGTTSVVEASSGDTFAVCPGQSETGVVTVASSLTLNALANTSTDIAYAEVVIDLAVGASVTAGSNITFVDTPEAGKRNICVVRWQGGSARLYVVDVMDLPA